jgi:hypothetical protein
LNGEEIEEADCVGKFDIRPIGFGIRRKSGASAAAIVEHDHPAAICDERGERLEIAGIAGETAKAQDRRTERPTIVAGIKLKPIWRREANLAKAGCGGQALNRSR